jgi:hypothetical protein
MVGLPFEKGLDLRSEAAESVAKILTTRLQAPLGHVLFRAAWTV